MNPNINTPHSSSPSQNSHLHPPTPSKEKDPNSATPTASAPQPEPLTPERPPDAPRTTPGREPNAPWPSAERIAQIDAEAQARRAAFLARRLRERMSQNKSPLDDLPPERQQALYELLQDNPSTIVCEMLAQPEPLGWNLQIGTSSLKRFRTRYRKQLEAQQRAEALAEANQILNERGAEDPEFLEATERILKLRLFTTASDPESQSRELAQLFRIVDRHRRTNLAEQKLKNSAQPSAAKK